MINLVWLRNDLRLEDNPALYHASQQGEVCCVYTLTPKQWQIHDDAPAKIALWRQRLIELESELKAKGIPLRLLSLKNYKDCPKAILKLVQELKAQRLFFNQEYPLNEKDRDDKVSQLLEKNNIQVHPFHGDVIIPPGNVLTQQGQPYKVFTPFANNWRRQLNQFNTKPLPSPKKQHCDIKGDSVEKQWINSSNFRNDLWVCDTKSIRQHLQKFVTHKSFLYKEKRDFPGINGTSTLSPYLTMGAISSKQCLYLLQSNQENFLENQWATELIWREFYRHLIDTFPHLSRSEDFINHKPIKWDNNDRLFQAWCEGKTGFPIVDAAMRQLLQTGWMHNRLRMVVAAFLTKLLLVDWRQGEAFFIQHLVDGDYAANNGGWQWSASTGADAAPYFRIFNPLRQSQKFDPEGTFIKKMLPELSSLDKKSIHQPNSEQRKKSDYPEPIINYELARKQALEIFGQAMGTK